MMGSHVLFVSSESTVGEGIAILLHERRQDHIKSVVYISDRMIFLDMPTDQGMIRPIQVHAPHAGYSTDELEVFDHMVFLALNNGRAMIQYSRTH